MSSNQDVDRTEALRSEIVRGIVDQLGVPESVAMPFAGAVLAHLQSTRGGGQLYVPKPARRYDLLQIEAQLRAGDPPHRVARRHETSVRQLHRLFPGGLPRPDQVA